MKRTYLMAFLAIQQQRRQSWLVELCGVCGTPIVENGKKVYLLTPRIVSFMILLVMRGKS